MSSSSQQKDEQNNQTQNNKLSTTSIVIIIIGSFIGLVVIGLVIKWIQEQMRHNKFVENQRGITQNFKPVFQTIGDSYD